MKKTAENNVKKRKSVCVRISDEQYKLLERVSFERKQSIPSLLIENWFDGSEKRPLMDSENSKKMILEIKRIGTNINQIARHLNSGFRAGWSNAFEDGVYELMQLRKLLGNKYGDSTTARSA